MAAVYTLEALRKLKETMDLEDIPEDLLAKFEENLPFTPELYRFITEWFAEVEEDLENREVRKHELVLEGLMRLSKDMQDDEKEWLRFLKLLN